MIDTIAAITTLDRPLDDGLFGGSALVTDHVTGSEHSRMWLNPSGDQHGAAPRLTYWPDSMTLKAEVSLPKLCNLPEDATTDDALDALNAWIGDLIPGLDDVRKWRCQRVDYCWQWDTSPFPATAYLDVLSRLPMSGARRHSFKGEGVVWKNNSRWVKFYDKGKEQSVSDKVLRFEVSNYGAACRYMADQWFDCERTVVEMVRPDRALYVLRWTWRKLGLEGVDIGDVQRTIFDLRKSFGVSTPNAFYYLHLCSMYGRDAINMGLTSASSFTAWRTRLRKAGFLVRAGDDDDKEQAVRRGLPPLHLPEDVGNLGVLFKPLADAPDKNFGGEF